MRLIETLTVNCIKSITVISPYFSKNGLKLLFEQLYDASHSDELKALTAGIGVFLGILPIWGFQTVAAISLAIFFRLNKALVLLFSHISLPPLIPLVVFLSYRAGGLWMGTNSILTRKSSQNFNTHLQQYIFGSISLAFAVGIATALLTYFALKLVRFIKQYRVQPGVEKELLLAYPDGINGVEK